PSRPCASHRSLSPPQSTCWVSRAPPPAGVPPRGGPPSPTPPPPVRRGHRVIRDGDLEERSRDVRRLDERPRTVPGGPNVPSVGEDPVLMSIEEDVRRRTRRVVHRAPLNNEERRRTRQMNPDVDTDLGVHGGRERRH